MYYESSLKHFTLFFLKEEFNENVTLQAACGCSIPCSITEYTTRISHAMFPAKLYEDWIKENFGYTSIR